MKKFILALFWIGQFALGIMGILAFHQDSKLVGMAYLGAAFFSMFLAGRVLGISRELAEQAQETVPGAIRVLFTGSLVVAVGMNALHRLGIEEISGVHVGLTVVQLLIVLFAACAVRDVFLARFYFTTDLSRPTS